MGSPNKENHLWMLREKNNVSLKDKESTLFIDNFLTL